MKKIAILAATALACTTALTTPAFAQSAASMATMQAVCDASKPNNNNRNHTYTAAVNVGTPSSNTLEVSRVTISQVLPSTVPVLGAVSFESGSETIRGGSPNIHGTFKQTATYDGGSVTQRVTTATDTTYPYGCTVTRTTTTNATPTPSAAHPVGTYSITERQTNLPTVETVDGVDITEDFFTDAVICISPSKGTVWRVKNEYPLGCDTALYTRLLALSEKPLRSNSVPGLSPVRPSREDHSQPEPDSFSNPIPLVDNLPDEDEG